MLEVRLKFRRWWIKTADKMSSREPDPCRSKWGWRGINKMKTCQHQDSTYHRCCGLWTMTWLTIQIPIFSGLSYCVVWSRSAVWYMCQCWPVSYSACAWKEKLAPNSTHMSYPLPIMNVSDCCSPAIHFLADDQGEFARAMELIFDATPLLGGPQSKVWATFHSILKWHCP